MFGQLYKGSSSVVSASLKKIENQNSVINVGVQNILKALEQRLSKVPNTPEINLSQRFYAYLGPNVALTRLHDGHHLFVDPEDQSLTPHLIAHGFWEQWIEKVVRQLVKRGDRIVEVGANLGYYTVIMANIIGDLGNIDAFEANPRIANLLERSVAFNGYAPRVKVHEAAAADQGGTLSFATSRRFLGSGTISQDLHAIGGDTELITVPAMRLDDAIPAGSIDVLRMDAEGAEPAILLGAMDLLDRSPSIRICAEWSMTMMAGRSDVPALIDQLDAKGFRFWRIEYSSELNPLTKADLLASHHCDVVMSRCDPFTRD